MVNVGMASLLVIKTEAQSKSHPTPGAGSDPETNRQNSLIHCLTGDRGLTGRLGSGVRNEPRGKMSVGGLRMTFVSTDSSI